MDKMKEIISLLDAGYSREEINEMLNDPGKEQSPADESAEAPESAQESEKAEPEEPAAPVDNSAEIKALADEVKALKQLIQKQIRKAAAVTRCDPSLRIQDDRAVKPHVIAGLLHALLPPGTLYVVLELNAERTVIPRVCQAPIDLRAGENKTAVLTKGYDLVHGF